MLEDCELANFIDIVLYRRDSPKSRADDVILFLCE